ncbi:DUF4290 domain-containing protein [Candidatus Azobacteroides pseudotrichonymphae]|uniref:DUF4290 domain-containing protein n=1 Tax=Azobacteroides pseudotrichonymphae genomovar. CFP2 TaxID=511995 RepID=B6YRE9_AZOPC|nr:DUF4290 domain-containing protein [Candidatus Azobacteroides pseudotrichonymphae]BAG83771.1 conserved hypothetical protein [Candidatus Azobacteroides pseudotrichonymphae genomovar. CFP2]
MIYNTKQKRLSLPEYGRNIQNMVDHCISISDREVRKKCANVIINIMGNMFPHLRDINNFKHILWDHLAIMASFSLDIDYPYEVVKKEDLYIKPSKLPYPQSSITCKYYGKNVEKMICRIIEYEEGERKKHLIKLLIIHMKKNFLLWNKEIVDIHKILEDLKQLSKGSIILDEDHYKLIEAERKTPRNFGHNRLVCLQKSKK